jgi:hypothetical protein
MNILSACQITSGIVLSARTTKIMLRIRTEAVSELRASMEILETLEHIISERPSSTLPCYENSGPQNMFDSLHLNTKFFANSIDKDSKFPTHIASLLFPSDEIEAICGS